MANLDKALELSSGHGMARWLRMPTCSEGSPGRFGRRRRRKHWRIFYSEAALLIDR